MSTWSLSPPGPEGEGSSVWPLSSGQQSLWFLHRASPKSTALNIGCAARLRRDLDRDCLLEALHRVFARHPAFRTEYFVQDGLPVQRVREHVEFPFEALDATGWTDEQLGRRLREETERPFELERDSLCRGHLFTREGDNSVLLLSAHHVAFDGWSLWLCLKEITAIYRARLEGSSGEPPAPKADYLEFVRRQREWLATTEAEEGLAFWRERLAGDLPVLDLPTDQARPAAPEPEGASLAFHLDEALTARLDALARDEGATLNAVLLAAFQTLLHRYSGQEEVVVGCPAAGRSGAEFRRTVGYFVNPLAVRGDLSGDPSFESLLRRTSDAVRASLEHQDYPFARLVDELGVEREPSRSPLFQASFVFQKPGDLRRLGALVEVEDERPLVERGGLNLGSLTLLQREDQHDLALEMAEHGGALAGVWKYRADLFDESTAARMCASFRALLEAVACDAERAISELPLLAEAEREAMLERWNDTDRDFGASWRGCLHELFERQAARTPEAVAVEYDGGSLTFAELGARARRLARGLRARGVGPDVVVGLHLHRGPEMIVALLAILEAGGAYLPLDPAYPGKRLELMLRDSGAHLVLTEARLEPALESGEVPRLLVDALEASAIEEDDSALDPLASPDDLAFVIYTSGSTGVPKGVAMPHRAIANLVAWQLEETHLAAGARTLQFTSLSFDVSIQEIFTAWGSGGTLVLVAEEVRQDVERLAEFVAERRIERLFLPFVALQQLAEELRVHPHDALALGEVVTAGEQLQVTPAIVALFERLEGCALVNQYGPTESHVVTAHRLEGAPRSWPVLPPIGRPIANARVYVLDARGEPVPVGVAGELHLAGAGLARGYLNRPELTAERFRPDPFDPAGTSRLFRTGDLARYRPDGELEFLGRADHQLKVRGYRVEPGEIEALLCEHEAVREAVVVLHRERPGNARLVAHVVTREPSWSLARELRGFLAEHLPRYMVPAAFVHHRALPKTPSGKVDRRRLAEVTDLRAESADGLEAPSTPVEELVAGIWREVLGLDGVGRDQSFFELGGHSLLATQVASRVREVFGVELPLRAVFEAPTLLELSERIEEERDSGRGLPDAPPLVPVPRGGDLPLSFSQERMWFLHQLAPESAAYNMGVAFRVTGEFDVGLAERCLCELVRRHENLRTTFHSKDGLPTARVSAEVAFELEHVDLRELPATERDREARARATDELRRPFDLERGPLLRVVAYRLAEDEHVVLLGMHHVVSDLWTFGVLFRELAELYAGGGPDGRADAAMPSLQYTDFASWQRRWFTGDVLERQLVYWRERLAGVAVLDLPTDKPRSAVRGNHGALEALELPPELVAAIEEFSIEEGATPFMTLLAVFELLLSRRTGQADVVVGSPIANRTRLEVESMTGTFVNTLAMRTDLSGDPSFAELLRRVRETTLGAYANQDLPFEKLVEELAPERDLSHSPVVQVLFNLANAPFEEPRIDGLAWSPFELDRGAAQFELSLFVDLEVTRKVYVEYDTDLFERDTVRALLRHYRNALQAVLERPELSVSRVPLLDEAERRRLLVEWNATEAEYPRERCLHELLAERCEQGGERVAVVHRDVVITAGELRRRAGGLARVLHERGVGPGSLVGIYLERSIDMVVALLGVLEAGGAYVPLDPDFPAERLAFMVEDARVAIVLTHTALAGSMQRPGVETLCLDAKLEPRVESAEPLPPLAGPDDLAYVVYTSGSTGKPKGVQIPHRALLNFLESMRREPGLGEDDVLLAVTTLSFDIAALELFLPLLTGAKLVICDRETTYDGRKLSETIARSEATVMQATPATWRLLIESGWRGRAGLKILCGGEALSRELADALLVRCGSLWNMYGPTETTIWSTIWKVERRAPISIGRPIANTQIYLLDANLEPVPAGVPGELYIGGDGLARGYLDRPELSAQKFVPHPFDATPGARIHRTGDLARWLPDGRIECLDRTDNQVKIRGFRIDLGEVESALSASEDLVQNVVVAREDDSGHRRLVAYVVAAPGRTPTLARLRTLLKKTLPGYMVPSLLVVLERLPQTPNGKVDRRTLPEPEEAAAARERPLVAPRTQVERRLLAIWAEVLGVSEIGVQDDFFDLGGHSLLAARLMDRIRRELGVELPLRSIFEDSNVAGMARKLRLDSRTGAYRYDAVPSAWTSLVSIQPKGSRRPLFLVSGTYSGEDAFLGYMANLVPHLGPDQPVFGFRARGLDGQEDPHLSTVEMARDYVAELRSYQPKGPYVLGGECVGGVVAFEMARQLEQSGEKVDLLVLLDTVCPSAWRALQFRGYLALAKLRSIARHLGAVFQRKPGGGLRHLEELLRRKRRLHFPASEEEIARNRIEQIERSYARMMFRYRPEPYSGKLTLLLNQGMYASDRTQGWQRFVRGGIDSFEVPGDHLTRITEFVGETARCLSARLDELDRTEPTKEEPGAEHQRVA